MKFKFILSIFILAACAVVRAEEPPPSPRPWSGNAGAGLTLTRGNSDTSNVNLSFVLAYDPATRNIVKFDALYLRGSSEGELLIDRANAGIRDEYRISGRAFAFGEVRWLRDHFKQIDSLITPVVGAGYDVIQSEPMKLSVDGGVGGVIEQNTNGASSSDAAFQGRQLFAWKISPTASFTQTASGLWKFADTGDALYHLDAAISTTITPRSELKVAAASDTKTRLSDPALKKTDTSLLVALVMKF